MRRLSSGKDKKLKKDWYRLPTELLENKSLTLSSAVLYAILLDKTTEEKKTVKTTAKKLAESLGESEKTVQRALKQLSELGYISKKQTGKGIICTILIQVIADKKRQEKITQEQIKQDQTEQEEKKKYKIYNHLNKQQIDALCKILATKVNPFRRTRKNLMERLEEEYNAVLARPNVENIAAYLTSTIKYLECEYDKQAYEAYEQFLEDFQKEEKQ